MTIFLLEYEPATGKRLRLDRYDEGRRAEALAARLRLEKENVQRGLDREVVLLEAVSEEALKTTHARYFKTLEELVEGAGVPAPA